MTGPHSSTSTSSTPSGRGAIDPVDRAHLTGSSRPTPPIHRYPPADDLTDLVDRYWIPVWQVAEPQQQTTVPYPGCLMVITSDYARLYGVARGSSSVVLEGIGWAVGVLLRPATGALLLGRAVTELTDRHLPLSEVPGLAGATLTDRVRAVMAVDPTDPTAHAAAIGAYEQQLRPLLPVDDSGRMINDVIDWLRDHPEVTRVDEVADRFALSERTLQRLVHHRVGWSPKWLIQRRRLHDAIGALKAGRTSLADLAADLGYTDQAHFTHDFTAVAGVTPGRFLADQPPAR